MQVKTTVHESGVNQVKPGLPATVRVDARPRVSYKGSVRSVAVLPDQSSWLNSDVKAYETIVRVDEEVERLQPGMTAVVEIEVAHAHDVLIAPVEAIVQIDGAEWCYVNEGGNIERRHVALGAMNDQFAEVQSGLDQGDQVVRNPMAVADEAKGRQQMASPGREAGDAGG
jgi:hypothetical protein